MAYENPVLVTSFPTTTDLSASQYSAVVLSSGNAALAGAAANAIGFLQNKPDGSASGEQITTASVMVIGITRAIASAAISEGDKVGCAASGEIRTAAASDHVVGIALEAAGASGDIIAVLIATGGGVAP